MENYLVHIKSSLISILGEQDIYYDIQAESMSSAYNSAMGSYINECGIKETTLNLQEEIKNKVKVVAILHYSVAWRYSPTTV